MSRRTRKHSGGGVNPLKARTLKRQKLNIATQLKQQMQNLKRRSRKVKLPKGFKGIMTKLFKTHNVPMRSRRTRKSTLPSTLPMNVSTRPIRQAVIRTKDLKLTKDALPGIVKEIEKEIIQEEKQAIKEAREARTAEARAEALAKIAVAKEELNGIDDMMAKLGLGQSKRSNINNLNFSRLRL